MTTTETVRVNIPAGIEDGATRLVNGAGSRPRADKPSGDLEITMTVRPHPFFKRVGDDVVCAVPLSFASAALGGEVDVPTLDGKGKLHVPAGTQSGTVLRIKGKGIPHRGGLGRGDQHVEVNIEVPTKLTVRQRQLLEELAMDLGEDVQSQQKTFMEKLRDLFDRTP
jgi:molecular chaperone DnaJ